MDLGFDEVTLPEDVARGLKVRRRFSTNIQRGANKSEFRDRNWGQSERSFEIVFDVWDQERWDQLDEFFEARFGRWRGFRVVDPSHYMAGYYYAGFNTYTVGTPVVIGTGDGVTKTFQCAIVRGGNVRVCKKLSQREGAPCRGYVAGIEVSASFNLNNGRVTFASAPPSGAVVSAAFFYDIPCRFDTDEIEATFDALIIGKTGMIPIIEMDLPNV